MIQLNEKRESFMCNIRKEKINKILDIKRGTNMEEYKFEDLSILLSYMSNAYS